MTFGLGQRKEFCPKPLRALRIACRVVLCSGSTFHGETALSPSPSHAGGVVLLIARTCNEIVPAHKEFLRARQTPVPLTCIVCWVLACTDQVPGICCTWNERLETGVRTTSTRTIKYYYCCCCTYIVVAHIPTSLLNFEGVACRILFTSSANTPKTWWEGNLLFFADGEVIF